MCCECPVSAAVAVQSAARRGLPIAIAHVVWGQEAAGAAVLRLEVATTACILAAEADPAIMSHIHYDNPYGAFTRFAKRGVGPLFGPRAGGLQPRKLGLPVWQQQLLLAEGAADQLPKPLLEFMKANHAAAEAVGAALSRLVYACPKECDFDIWQGWAGQFAVLAERRCRTAGGYGWACWLRPDMLSHVMLLLGVDVISCLLLGCCCHGKCHDVGWRWMNMCGVCCCRVAKMQW